MTNNVAHRRWWQIFEVVFGLPFLIGLALHLAVPLSFPQGLPIAIRLAAGVVLMSIGLALVIAARRIFARYKQPTDPGQPSSMLIETGVFAISRNPLYLGGLCTLLGLALAFNRAWAMILLLPALIICHYVLILPEEHYLTVTFGAAYQRYMSRVPRWIGIVRGLAEPHQPKI